MTMTRRSPLEASRPDGEVMRMIAPPNGSEGYSTMTLRAARFLNTFHAAVLALFVLSLGAGLARAQDGGDTNVSSSASPQGTACTGRDLRPTLGVEAPELLRRVREQGAQTPNGEGRLWRVTTPEGAVSHLYGTMHVSDPAVVALGAEAQSAYDGASVVVIETIDILDQQKAAAALWAKPELMTFTDGTSLLDHMDEEEERVLETALAEQSMSLSAVKTIKPWILAGTLSLPACERGAARDGFLDLKLARDAQEAGREVAGLETALEQMEAIASLPLDMHIDSLIESARMGSDLDDVFATMGALYSEGRIGEIWPFLRALSEHMAEGESAEMDEAMIAAFDEAIITRRNHTMAERAEPLLSEGGAFIAVGALHLPGDEGLVALFEDQGHTVEMIAP